MVVGTRCISPKMSPLENELTLGQLIHAFFLLGSLVAREAVEEGGER